MCHACVFAVVFAVCTINNIGSIGHMWAASACNDCCLVCCEVLAHGHHGGSPCCASDVLFLAFQQNVDLSKTPSCGGRCVQV